MIYIVCAVSLFAGLLFGVLLTSILAVAKQADEDLDTNATQVIWRGRPHPFQVQKEVCWHYSEIGPTDFPEHWQVQALRVLYEVKDDSQPA